MARVYKASFYMVDPDKYLKDHLELERMLNYSTCRYGILHQLHVEQSDQFDWNDKSPMNFANCDLAELESHFKHDTAQMNVKVGGVYRHFKGHTVKVLAVSRGTEYGEWNVVYEHLGDHTVWHRPVAMFCSEVDHDKYPDVKQKMRFELVE